MVVWDFVFLLLTWTSLWAIPSYKDSTENMQFLVQISSKLVWFVWRLSSESVRKSFHVMRQGPRWSIQKEISRFSCAKTYAIMINLCLTIQYISDYCAISDVAPNQASSQNLNCESSLTEKVPNWENNFLTLIMQGQKCEYPGF